MSLLAKISAVRSAMDDKWITTKAKAEGAGKHILLDDQGNIKGGSVPREMQGKPLKQGFSELRQRVDKASSTMKPKTKLEPSGPIPSKEKVAEMSKRFKHDLIGDIPHTRKMNSNLRKKAWKQKVLATYEDLKENPDIKAYADQLKHDPGWEKAAGDTLGKGIPKDRVSLAVAKVLDDWGVSSGGTYASSVRMQKHAINHFSLKGADTQHLGSEETNKADKEARKDINAKLDELKSHKAYQEYQDLNAKYGKELEEYQTADNKWLQEYWKNKEDPSHPLPPRPQISKEANSVIEASVKVHMVQQEIHTLKGQLANLRDNEDYSSPTGIEAKAFSAILDSQYNRTQQYFKDKGITHIEVYRGVLTDNQKGVIEEANISLQPISSFSVAYDVAHFFSKGQSFTEAKGQHTAIMKCVIPVEHILSTPETGFGALHEGEVTVLAHDLKGSIVVGNKIPTTEDGYNQLFAKGGKKK